MTTRRYAPIGHTHAATGDVTAADDETITGEWTFTDQLTIDFDGSSGSNWPLHITGNDPLIMMTEEDAAADEQKWIIGANGGGLFRILARNDADNAGTTPLSITRGTGTAIDEIELNATDLDFNATMDVSGAVTLNSTLAVASTLSLTTGHIQTDSSTHAFGIEALSLADDATGTWTLPGSREGGLIFLTDTNTSNAPTSVYGIMYIPGTGTAVLIAGSTGTLSLGSGSNPDVDGDINVWCGTAGIISVKNRRGATRRIQLVLMG